MLQTKSPNKLQSTFLSCLQEHPGLLLTLVNMLGCAFGFPLLLTRGLARLGVKGWPEALWADSLRKITASESQVIMADSPARQ